MLTDIRNKFMVTKDENEGWGSLGLIDTHCIQNWRRNWHPTPVLSPGKSRGQRKLVDYSPWGHRVGHD